jgi:hypothetical protein
MITWKGGERDHLNTTLEEDLHLKASRRGFEDRHDLPLDRVGDKRFRAIEPCLDLYLRRSKFDQVFRTVLEDGSTVVRREREALIRIAAADLRKDLLEVVLVERRRRHLARLRRELNGKGLEEGFHVERSG